jgi:hypothetical protein
MTVRVVGVYPFPESPDVDLIEVEIDRPPSRVDVGGFTQEEANVDRANWQVPYDERYLSLDGTREIGQRWSMGWKPQSGIAEPPTTRLVFFFHFLDTDRMLGTPDGAVALTLREVLPERLTFLEYEPPD